MGDVDETRPFFIVIAVIAMVGNSLVLLLFLKKRAWLKKTHNCLIFTLALQDVLTGFCLITVPSFTVSDDYYDVPENVFARELYCRMVWSQYLIFSLGITSIYTCVGLSIERWLAVFKPIYYRKFTQSRPSVAALVIVPWIVALAVEVGTVISVKNRILEDGSSFVCFWEVADSSGLAANVTQALFRFFGIIVVPGIVVAVSYIQIINRVRKSRNAVRCSNGIASPGNRNSVNLQKITIVAFLASSAVILFWLPSQLLFMLVQLGLAKNNSLLHKIFKVLAFSNSCLNPFIYCFSKASYRKGFIGIVLEFTKVPRSCT